MIGINVRSDGPIRYADLIVDGIKTLETREHDSLAPYVGKQVAIIRTGEGKAQAIGTAIIGKPIYIPSLKAFRALQDLHMVPAGSKFDIKPGGVKILYPLAGAMRWPKPRPVAQYGIVAREVFEYGDVVDMQQGTCA